jgi:DNA-binding XRE family transcriptional regulator
MSALAAKSPQPDHVLAKALLNTSEQLGLTQQELARVIGLHRTGITRLKKSISLDPSSKSGELALCLIRAARALYALSGGDKDWIEHFMRSRNRMTGGVPAEQVQSIQGLMRVLQYLDAIRGKV